MKFELDALAELNRIMKSGEFHHATIRQQGSRTDLNVYVKSENGFNGYNLARLALSSWSAPETWTNALDAISQTGYSVGSYGRGWVRYERQS